MQQKTKTFHFSAAILLAALVSVQGISDSYAGIYSTPAENTNPGAPDPGVRGLIDGEVNPIFKGWATYVVDYSPAPGVNPSFQNTDRALGPVTGSNMDVVVLGDLNAAQIAEGLSPGSIILGFAKAICNGIGADFAVFENGFVSGLDGNFFAELAYVEVSTDGNVFSRFPSISETPGLVGGYGTINATNVYNLAGKHANAYGSPWGTPFDLDDLLNDANVLDGLVDLSNINYVRIVDIPGSGDFLDSKGNPIYDAWVTWGTGGFDLEAVGVINQATTPEPCALLILGSFAAAGTVLRRRYNRERQ